MFGTPFPALWSAAHYKMPFLTVIFTNRSYSTGTTGLLRSYPDGAAAQAENFEGGLFDPAPDFGKLAEAVNGYGETVHDPERLAPALQEVWSASGKARRQSFRPICQQLSKRRVFAKARRIRS